MAKVSVLKCSSYDEGLVYKTIKSSLELIDFKLKENSKVLIKPNVLSQYKPEESITTHPSIIGAVCRILKEKNCKIIIGDSSGFFQQGGTKKAFKVAGIEEVAKKYSALLIPFEASRIITIEDEKAFVLKKINITSIVKEVDLIINLPKLKTHTLTKYTGAVKNLFGCVPGALKQKYHSIGNNEERFCNLLLDIYQNIKPGLNIMDGIIGIEGDGPSKAGKIKKAGIILSSKDAVALDIVASGIIGFKPEEIFTNKFVLERNLFDGKIEVLGEKNLKIPYKKPLITQSHVPSFFTTLIFRSVRVFPFLNKKKCKKCGICAGVCPVNAIKMKDYPIFNRRKCITCFCCHELCPEGAIDLKRPKTIEALSYIWRKVRSIRKK